MTQSGMFSTDGIIQSDTTNNTFIQCSTTHLTSFAVLVDVVWSKCYSLDTLIACSVTLNYFLYRELLNLKH